MVKLGMPPTGQQKMVAKDPRTSRAEKKPKAPRLEPRWVTSQNVLLPSGATKRGQQTWHDMGRVVKMFRGDFCRQHFFVGFARIRSFSKARKTWDSRIREYERQILRN